MLSLKVEIPQRKGVTMRPKMVYTDDFRRKVVQEIVSGKWTGYKHAQRVYGIKGCETVRKWMARYGYGHLLERIVVMKSNEEVDEVKKLTAEVKRLKESLADVYLDLQIEKQLSLILLKESGKTREDVKKNMRGRSLTGS
jgi:transposase-like protein